MTKTKAKPVGEPRVRTKIVIEVSAPANVDVEDALTEYLLDTIESTFKALGIRVKSVGYQEEEREE